MSFLSHYSDPILLFRQRQLLDSAALEKAVKHQGESEIPCVSRTAPPLQAHLSDCIFCQNPEMTIAFCFMLRGFHFNIWTKSDMLIRNLVNHPWLSDQWSVYSRLCRVTYPLGLVHAHVQVGSVHLSRSEKDCWTGGQMTFDCLSSFGFIVHCLLDEVSCP